MKRVRRTALAAVLLFASGSAGAQPAYDRLRLIAPAAPGGGWDQTARALQRVLAEVEKTAKRLRKEQG